MDFTPTLDTTSITDSIMQSLAVPLMLGTIITIVFIAVWIIAKVMGALQTRRAYEDLREIRRLLTEINRRDTIRFDREQAAVSASQTPPLATETPTVDESQ